MEGDCPGPQFSDDVTSLPSVEELAVGLKDRFLRCQVCTQLYVTDQRCPKVLPCGHGLCSDCLEQASRPEKVRCQQCSPVRVVFGQPVPDRTRVELMELISKFTTDVDCSDQDGISTVPDAASLFLTGLKEQLLTCKICEHAYDSEDHKLVTFFCQHELCSRCEAKMGEEGKKECPFCRKEFHRRLGSPEDMLPAQLLKWLQPFLPALSSMTSNPATVVLDRLDNLHDVLENTEDKVIQRQHAEVTHESHQGVGTPDDTDLIYTKFADACVNLLKECITAESVSSPEVWSILLSVLDKMFDHARGTCKAREAMLEVGALQLLIQDCWDRQFLNQLSTEKRLHLVKASWKICDMLLFEDDAHKRLKAIDSVMKMLVEKVELDNVEDGVTLGALRLISWMEPKTDGIQTWIDNVAQLGLPARLVRICQAARRENSIESDVCEQTLQHVYNALQRLTYSSEAFSAGVIDGGLPTLIVDTYTQLQNAQRQDGDVYSVQMIAILDNLSRFPDLHRSLIEKGIVGLLMPCMEHENKGLAMLTTFILAQLCTSHEDIESFQEHFNKEGVLLRMKSWTESSLSVDRRRFEYPQCPGHFVPQDMLTCLCQVVRHPGQQIKVVESGWLELLCRLLDEGKEEEKRLVLDCLLTLSQSPDVGGHLAENEALLAKVRALQDLGGLPAERDNGQSSEEEPLSTADDKDNSLSQASSLLLSRLRQHDSRTAGQAEN